MKDYIRLLINRKWETLPTKDILYITIADKLSFFYLNNDTTLNLFITLSELEQQLPKKSFVRISRSCIINFQAVCAIHDSHIKLQNGKSLSYSKRREKTIMEKYRDYQKSKASPAAYGANDVSLGPGTPDSLPCLYNHTLESVCRRFVPLLAELDNSQLYALEKLLSSMLQEKNK